MRKRILLTGGCGFIGSHLTEAYLTNDFEVIIVDNLSSGKKKNLSSCIKNPNLQIYNADIRNRELLLKIIDRHKPNVINHHAAQKSIPSSMKNPIHDANENIIGLLNIIMACAEYPIDNFVYISSGGALSKEIIGIAKSAENDIPLLESPYAITKYSGENYVKLYSKLFSFDYSIMRYSNVYGPKQTTDGECGVIPIFIKNILNNHPSVLYTYEDMPNGCIRDYIYVKDVVEANISVTNSPINDTINISSSSAISILEIYNHIQKIFGNSSEIQRKGPRPGDIKRSVLDNSKAKKLLNWSPKTSIINGLTEIKNNYLIDL